MSDCCTDKLSSSTAKAHACPANGRTYARVKRKTILHHMASPWQRPLADQAYYFCTDADCEVVYFGRDNTTIDVHSLRTTVWQKSGCEQDLLCYCFGITKKLADSDESIKTFVIEQTRNGCCSCETSNPSGRCCLKDFPEQ